VLTSIARFLIEFIRINERVALGVTAAQWSALAIAAAGVWLIVAGGSLPAPAPVRRVSSKR
jgi:prolipoprotein diacylglyceryltransferase